MTKSHTAQPDLADLFAGYLRRQTAANQEGVGLPDVLAEVVPHDPSHAQPQDPRLAWQEAVAVLRIWQPDHSPIVTPPEWSNLALHADPAVSLAFAVGNFPQLIRDLKPLLHGDEPGKLLATSSRAIPAAALLEWSARQTAWPSILIGLGTLRLARQFEAAAELIAAYGSRVLSAWKPALANEAAALAWHRGQHEEAAASWESQVASPPVLFNRGMAALFLGRKAEAKASLGEAVKQLPEDSSWHHLGCLYLALATG